MPAKMSSNLSRRSQRKKQTRLAFDPVESSSSATFSPARVRYQPSSPLPKMFNLISPERQTDDGLIDALPPSKKYAVRVEVPKKEQKNGRIPFESLITPVGSSQTHIEAAKSTMSSESDTSDSDLEIIPSSRRQHIRLSGKPVTLTFMSSHKRRREIGYDGAEDSSSNELPIRMEEHTTFKKVGPRRGRSQKIAKDRATTPVEDTDEESPLESPIRASVRGGQAVLRKSESEFLKKSSEPKAKVTRNFIAGGSSYSAPINQKGTSKKKIRSSSKSTPRLAKTKREAAITSSDEADNVVVPSSPWRTNRQRTHSEPTSTTDKSDDALPDLPTLLSSSARKVKNNVTFAEALKTDSENNDSEDIITRSSPRRRRLSYVHKGEDEDDDEPILSTPMKRRKRVVQADSGTDELNFPSKRLRVGDERNVATKESETKRVTRKQQQQKKPHRSEREKKLQLLKRQRAGEKITELTSSESDEEPVQALYDSNSELEVLSEFEDEEENDAIHLIRESLRPLNRNNDDDDDFVVDDDEDPLGIPDHGLHDIPLQFTHQAHKRAIEHFKDAIEWLVQNKVNPGFNRNDPIYAQAFRKVDVEVRGYADSKYTSASWNAPFTRALSTRPEFFVEALGPADMSQGRKCGACGRTNHPASYQIQFSGKAYNKETLEEIDNDHDDEEDSDEDDNASINSKGESIPSAKTSWYVGRTCKGNAETAHSLKHWKYSLNEWVIGTLKSEGHLAPHKLAQREDWNKKKKSEYANEIVDKWWENKEIKALYRDFKSNLESAREGKTSRWRNQ